MPTLTIRMSDEEAQVAKQFAAFSGVSFSDFARKAILESIEDQYDIETLERAICEDNGERITHAELMREFKL